MLTLLRAVQLQNLSLRTPEQEAQAAREQTNGFKMDKSHTWVVCMFDDFDKLDRVPDEYQEAPPQEYKPMVRHCSPPQHFELLIPC